MRETRLTMINESLLEIPVVTLPQGFRFRYFKEQDEETWIRILTQAGEFPTEEAARERFRNEFSSSIGDLKERTLFIDTQEGESVGTAMGWYNTEFRDGTYGRLHWVSIIPNFQGQGLARPLVTQALKIMKEKHNKAYLTTRPRSYKGIKLYLDYGFKPLMQTKQCAQGWNLVEEFLGIKLTS
ncbi:MAG: GNAT family N-acetyltransferase [Firmicutes bacterium]|nr:GNAT family N-acetyltransferase [Bacillota bacterium]